MAAAAKAGAGTGARDPCSQAGLMWVPSRAKFLQKLGETEDSAARAAAAFMPAAEGVVAHVESLYDEPVD